MWRDFVRSQIDNCMRIFAAFIAESQTDFIDGFFVGKKISDMKDNRGNKMKDYILRQRLAEYDAKLDLVYRNFSEYVHLAEKAFYSSVTTSSSEQYVKDLISVSSDICSLLKKGEQALSNLERVEKQQDIMKDIYMDSFKGKILENITRYQVVEKGIIDDNKLEPLVQAEDMKVIVSRFEDIQEIFQDEYSATRIADGIRTETQELLTIDGIESVYVVFIKIPLQVFVSTNGWDIDIVAAKKKYNELLLEYKDEIIRQINNKKVLRAHWKKKTIQESYNGECLKEVERLVETIKAADFKKKKKQKEIDELQMKILSSRRLLDGEVKVLLDYLAENAQQVEMSVDNIDDWAYDKNFVGKLSHYVGKACAW